MTEQNSKKPSRRNSSESRSDKAARIESIIYRNWRTHSDRQMAELARCSNRTIGKYRKALEEAGRILPRLERTQDIKSCLREVCTSAILPSPENDLLYDPVREDDHSFQALVDDIRRNGMMNPIGVTREGFVFDGHRRLAAAKYLKKDRITVRVNPRVSRIDDPDEFLRVLKSCNEQRVKTTAEQVREGLVTMQDSTWQHVQDYRTSVSNVDGAEVFKLHGKKKRSDIVQKQGLARAITRIVNEYYADYGPISDRKVFYLCLNEADLLRNDVRKTPFLNNDKCYQDVTDMVTRLRLNGSIPFEAIVDETRPVVRWDTHQHAGTFVQSQTDSFLSCYFRDLLQSQPNHLELLVEKNTVAAELRRTAAKYTLPMTSGRGYSSLPPRKGMVDRFRESGKEKLVVIVVSDFDPEGQDIPNSFGLSLRDDFRIDPDRLVIVKAALTHQQVQELDLHEGQVAKEDSARYRRFVDTYGERCWELEALPTDKLQEIVEDTIRNTIDVAAFDSELEAQRSEQHELDRHRELVRNAIMKLHGDDGSLSA